MIFGKNIASFSVLYCPELNAIDNIVKSIRLGFLAVVYINQVDDAFIEKLRLLDVVILGDNINDGLGVAFSKFEDYLKERGIDFFVYFDQDTVVSEHAWLYILNTYYDGFSRYKAGVLFYSDKKSICSDVVVSSGCVFSINVIKKIGNHDASYFVEGVDYEFCLRLKKSGYKIYNVFTNAIDHFSLQDGRALSVFGRAVSVRVYGNRRLRDFNESHRRLIGDSFFAREYAMMLFFIKSFFVFNLREFYSRFLLAVF